MNTDLLKHLSNKIQAEISLMSDDLARGTAKDHGEYKYACGIVRGFMLANAILMDTATQMDEDDE